MVGYRIPIVESAPFDKVFESFMINDCLCYRIKGEKLEQQNYFWSVRKADGLYIHVNDRRSCLGELFNRMSEKQMNIIRGDINRLYEEFSQRHIY